MPASLAEIVDAKRAWLAGLPPDSQQPPATSYPRRTLFSSAQPDGRRRLIAEIKPKSPSGGILDAGFVSAASLLPAYQAHADAVSILTDEAFFGGSFDLLAEVSRTGSSTLCKDFILDCRQIRMACQAGASAILLIVKILTDYELTQLHADALAYGLTPVVEVQNQAELACALKLADLQVILINNRNLSNYTIDLQTTARLAPHIPDGVWRISASGIASPSDVAQVKPWADAILVGSSIMQASDRYGQLATIRQALN